MPTFWFFQCRIMRQSSSNIIRGNLALKIIQFKCRTSGSSSIFAADIFCRETINIMKTCASCTYTSWNNAHHEHHESIHIIHIQFFLQNLFILYFEIRKKKSKSWNACPWIGLILLRFWKEWCHQKAVGLSSSTTPFSSKTEHDHILATSPLARFTILNWFVELPIFYSVITKWI